MKRPPRDVYWQQLVDGVEFVLLKEDGQAWHYLFKWKDRGAVVTEGRTTEQHILSHGLTRVLDKDSPACDPWNLQMLGIAVGKYEGTLADPEAYSIKVEKA